MPTLLVVDDQRNVLNFVKDAMERRGWVVLGASTVDEGLEIAHTTTIDVALCDVVMPDAGGPEFALALWSVPGHVPLVLMTGDPTAWGRFERPLPAWLKPIPVVGKPFKVPELHAALELAMRMKGARIAPEGAPLTPQLLAPSLSAACARSGV